MPLKARIEEEAFQRALYALGTDQVCLLDSSSTTNAIWGHLCVLMNKADNFENRRSCYDMWKRKRAKFQSIVDELLQKNTFKARIHQFDPPSISVNDVKRIADTNTSTKHNSELEILEQNNEKSINIPVNVCKIVEINI
jgi:hypothetical protein